MSFDLAFGGWGSCKTTLQQQQAIKLAQMLAVVIPLIRPWQTWDNVQFDAGSNDITIDCGAAVAIDYFAIAAHELFTSNTDNIVLRSKVAFLILQQMCACDN